MSIIIDMTTRPNVKALYVELPTQEFVRLKVHATCYDQTIQMVVRRALSEYLSSNRVRDKLGKDN